MIEDMVCAISLVHIVVQDGDTIDIVSTLQVSGSHCDVVKDAKAVDSPLLARMMARWSYYTKPF